jgi:hypothetical protein
MKFYWALKKNEILPFSGKWMELEIFILSEVGQVQTTKRYLVKCVEYRPNTKISNIMYTYKYIQNMHPKVGLVDE